MHSFSCSEPPGSMEDTYAATPQTHYYTSCSGFKVVACFIELHVLVYFYLSFILDVMQAMGEVSLAFVALLMYETVWHAL